MRLAVCSPVSLALLLSLALGGCSGGGGDTSTPSATGAPAAGGGTTTPTGTTPPATDDLVAGPAPPTNVNTTTQPPGGNTVAGNTPDPSTGTGGSTTPPPSTNAWGTPTILARLPGQLTRSDVQTDSAGNALAVWRSDGPEDLYASRYNAGTRAWSAPELLETLPPSVLEFDLQVAPNGRAIVAWFQGDGGTHATYARRFTPATGWGAVEPIDTETSGRPAAAIDNAGNAYVVYVHAPAPNYASTFFGRAASAATPFGAPEQVSAPTTRLAIADLGIAGSARTALFLHDTTPLNTAPGAWHVYSTRYSGGAWTALERFDDEANEVSAARLSMNEAGDARGYWLVAAAIKHRYAAAGSAWSPVETIAFSPSGYRRGAGMNINGEAMLASSGPSGVLVARYTPTQGWGPYVSVFARRGFVGTLQAPRLAADGKAALSWMHGDPETDSVDWNTYHLWANVTQ